MKAQEGLGPIDLNVMSYNIRFDTVFHHRVCPEKIGDTFVSDHSPVACKVQIQ